LNQTHKRRRCVLRGSGEGFRYNFGRGMGALFPALVGASSVRYGHATANAIFSVVALRAAFD
jgi:hypothetical protein